MCKLLLTNVKNTNLIKIIDIGSWTKYDLDKFLKVYASHDSFEISISQEYIIPQKIDWYTKICIYINNKGWL